MTKEEFNKMKAELENIQRLIPIPNNLWKMNIASTDGQCTCVHSYYSIVANYLLDTLMQEVKVEME